jgi:hypothetical protein
MKIFRKNYEADAPTATSGGSIAELMAASGVMNTTEEMVATPIQITEQKEEPTATKVEEPAATATLEPNVDTAKSETPLPTAATEQAQNLQKVEPQVPQPKWQEVLKSQQPDSVLKELGFDDKLVRLVNELKEFDPNVWGLIQSYKEGKHIEYLRELTTDYKSMSAEEVMRHQLRQEYPTASEAALDALYEEEVIDKYKLDEDRYTETETIRGKLLLDAKADRYRAELLKNQETKLLPNPPEAKAAEPDPKELLRAEMINSVTTKFNESAYTKNIISSNVFSIGEGNDKFNFPIDSKSIVDLVINGDTSGELMFDKQVDSGGKENYIPKAEHQILVATVNKYGMSFINELVRHAKSLGGKAAIEPIDNARPNSFDNSSKSDGKPMSAAEAMARGGRLT